MMGLSYSVLHADARGDIPLLSKLCISQETLFDPPPVGAVDDVDYSVHDCRSVIASAALSSSDCCEKRDLLARAKDARAKLRSERTRARAATLAYFQTSTRAVHEMHDELARASRVLGAAVPTIGAARDALARASAHRETAARARLRLFCRAAALNRLLYRALATARGLVEEGAPTALERHLDDCARGAPTLEGLVFVRLSGGDRYGSLLHAACRCGAAAVVAPLAKRLAPLDPAAHANADGNTPLHLAALADSMDAARQLLGLYARVGDEAPLATLHRAPTKSLGAGDDDVICEGPLSKRRETDRWLRRWVRVTSARLTYYHAESPPAPTAAPAFDVSLARAIVKRSDDDEAYTIELHSPDLIKGKNREGRLFFKAADEADVQRWLLACGPASFFSIATRGGSDRLEKVLEDLRQGGLRRAPRAHRAAAPPGRLGRPRGPGRRHERPRVDRAPPALQGVGARGVDAARARADGRRGRR